MAVELNALRDQFDAVVNQIIELLAQRLVLVAKVGEVKSEHGLPIYAPDREAAMLAPHRAEAEKMGVPPQLIADNLRRTMRASYAIENASGFTWLNPELRSVVILGGTGKLGSLFCRMF
ncbi:chorismate mutase, partial [Vibrio sp. S512-13]|uniref:chorismate mutase n=1 Tax=Vibrio sp. S512-13 TaxID=1620394 RepID=UPI0005EFF030